MRNRCWAMVLGAVLSQPVMALGDTQQVLSERPEAELFKDAPAPWRDYLLAARRAEHIEDALQRCLAYPDLPGNQWPAGHGRAHCLDHAVRAMPMASAQALLASGKQDQLDAYVRRLEAEHARKIDSSEEIHYFFQQFSFEVADAFTAAWLQAQPDNPYALTARANFHSGMARAARGGNWVSQTPREDLREMTRQYDLALPLYRKAVKIAPGFIEAWNGMLGLAYRDARPELEAEAFAAASAIDPGCQDLVDTRMVSLQPRWGGSYEAMLAYATSLKPLLAARPILAREVAAPYGDRGDRLIAEDELTSEAMDILDIAVRTGSHEEHLGDAANVAFNATDGSGDQWRALGYLLQQARFKDTGWWANVNIARMLMRREPVMALRYASRAVAADPDNPTSQYYLAASNYNSKHFDEADTHYRLAMLSPDFSRSSLDDVIRMWLFDAGLPGPVAAAKVKPDIDRMVREFPDDGRARLYRIESGRYAGGSIVAEWIRDFLARVNPDDPMQASYQQYLDRLMSERPGLREMVNHPKSAPHR